ncbi:MAG: hypothetical protein A2321_03920 [Omnitrophica WOR_2 bacterium RIFOXYB2_FULL_45_11]|nr:MAG: hypothetical protein A2321_03920 [Omnitrophica WOR_2 bacterium RIFOXYB2_FULL_45_11]
MQPIRTASEITANIIIQPLPQTPLYQKLAKKITELRLLGMPCKDIAKSLNIAKRTVTRAYKFQKILQGGKK